MSIDFSEVYRCNGVTPQYSPSGKYLATAVDFRLVVRDVETLNVVQLFSCLDKIQHVEWSNDSTFILCGMYKRAMVQAWCIEQPDWTCKIDEGPAGIASARWSPEGREILTVADFNIRMTVWSLANKSCTYIKAPKFPNKGCTFSPDGNFMALLERRDCKDFISIFGTQQWSVAAHFAIETSDAADISWSPDGGNICVWDTVLAYKMLVYAPDGRCLTKHEAYENALGIKSLNWCPSGQLLAVGSFDQVVRVFNHLTWKVTVEFSHRSNLKGPDKLVVYREVEEKTEGEGTHARYTVCALPQAVPNQKPPCDKPNPKLGVGFAAWSVDSRYLVTRNDNMPTAVWIWDMDSLELATVLLQQDPVKATVWDPVHLRLAISTGGSRVYVWTPDGASCVHVPLPGFHAHNIAWNPAGTVFVLADKDTFCCSYLGDP
ncbi:hypothetical protein CYMTET_13627 [Cymbomonas tetramitiformis]|uniref:Uncharacterized protein n=1 Tax=Cymbomonas tetramitiformis TaxID=36881 RepID=A0AAE0LB85_9CHLO|nr:hypothetical protein CYMTET_13627 [Cymbomonas tetramitiformis]